MSASSQSSHQSFSSWLFMASPHHKQNYCRRLPLIRRYVSAPSADETSEVKRALPRSQTGKRGSMGAFMPMVSHSGNRSLLESKDSCHCWSPGIGLQHQTGKIKSMTSPDALWGRMESGLFLPATR